MAEWVYFLMEACGGLPGAQVNQGAAAPTVQVAPVAVMAAGQ
jgi:hypothetical protein